MITSTLTYTVKVVYADGTTAALHADARDASDAEQQIVGRLAEECIEWLPGFQPAEVRVDVDPG